MKYEDQISDEMQRVRDGLEAASHICQSADNCAECPLFAICDDVFSVPPTTMKF